MRLLCVLALALLSGGCADDRTLSGPPSRTLRLADSAPQIIAGPIMLGLWGSHVWFEWEPDPPAIAYEWALTNLNEYTADTGHAYPTLAELVAWLETATERPGTGTPMWTRGVVSTVEFPNTPELENSRYIFGVRSVYADGHVSALQAPMNFLVFEVRSSLSYPHTRVWTNVGTCSTPYSAGRRTLFVPKLRFSWEASPGGSLLPIVTTEWRIDGTEDWTLSANESYPENEDERWAPAVGPHTFSVRATDSAGYQTSVDFEFDVVAPTGRGVLVVQDTNPDSPRQVPPGFEIIEAAHIDAWLSSRLYQRHATGGSVPPTANQLAQASTVIWFLGTDSSFGAEASVLRTALYQDPAFLLTLASWHAAGGNLVLSGFWPSHAMAAFRDSRNCTAAYREGYPLVFSQTEEHPTQLRHFALDGFGLAAVGGSVGGFVHHPPEREEFVPMPGATSRVPGYPDLRFDPLRWPQGTQTRGFGFYDVDLVPTDDAMVLYDRKGGENPVAVARLNGPGRTGSSVYLGFHPHFVDMGDATALFDRILSDFGELRVESREHRD
ncbi:MAG: hypothetical protein DHS20C21_20850 [Gemmatimonadota bacterium]|nr:MAG: hypothetical protein DHS20C21_20850 [Gemmatimonadota bacterium]